MTDLIHRLIDWVYVLLKGSGAPAYPRPPVPDVTTGQAQHLTPPLPAHRSPYAQDDSPLDGTALNSVRPYLLTQEQHQHRRILATATLDESIRGPYWVHGLEAA